MEPDKRDFFIIKVAKKRTVNMIGSGYRSDTRSTPDPSLGVKVMAIRY